MKVKSFLGYTLDVRSNFLFKPVNFMFKCLQLLTGVLVIYILYSC